MHWKSGLSSSVICILIALVVLLSVSSIEAKKKRKFDGDFEFADEEDTTKNIRKEGKKTWILDPGSDLCQALKCKKKELCLLEDEFTAVCVSKKELHKNGDVIVPKSKVKENTKLDDESSKETYDEDEDDDSDYYDEDEDSNEDLFSSNNKNNNKNNNKMDKPTNSKSNLLSSSSTLFQSAGLSISNSAGSGSSDSSFKSCTPCPVVKPTFLCGSDNRTYSSLCRLDYHNCIQNSLVTVACKGFCPCKELEELQKKKSGETERVSRFMQKYKKTVANLKMQQQQKLSQGKKPKNQNGFGSSGVSSVSADDNAIFSSNNDFASGTPLVASVPTPKDRYTKYKDYYGFKNSKFGMDKQRSQNEVVNTKPIGNNRDCNDEALESMGNRLLDWFSVVMADTQKRKLNRRNRNNQGVHFPGDCKREVVWMFSHLNSDEDGQLSLQELYDLENDRNEKCIKPFLDRCDTDKDIFMSPREWCSCFAKSDRPCRGVNCGGSSYSDRDDNELDDDDDTDIEGSSDGPLEI